MRWSFSPDEFAYAWERTGLEGYPYPIRVLESPRTRDEFEALRRVLATRRARFADTALSSALRIAAEPTVRVETFGVAPDGSDPIRVLAGIHGPAAVVISQAGGTTAEFGGPLSIELTSPDRVAHRIVESVPTAERGRAGACSASAVQVNGERSGSVLVSAQRRSGAAQVRKRLAMPRVRTGEVAVTRDESASERTRYLAWIDVVDDGRYLVRNGVDVAIAPASSEEFAAALRRMLR